MYMYAQTCICFELIDYVGIDVEVANWATVAELKQVVEGVFGFMPSEGDGKISWYFSFQI